MQSSDQTQTASVSSIHSIIGWLLFMAKCTPHLRLLQWAFEQTNPNVSPCPDDLRARALFQFRQFHAAKAGTDCECDFLTGCLELLALRTRLNGWGPCSAMATPSALWDGLSSDTWQPSLTIPKRDWQFYRQQIITHFHGDDETEANLMVA